MCNKLISHHICYTNSNINLIQKKDGGEISYIARAGVTLDMQIVINPNQKWIFLTLLKYIVTLL